MNSVIILSEKVDNKARKFGSGKYYYPTYIKRDNELAKALFTEYEIKAALERARKNPEDFPSKPKSWWNIF